MTRAKTADGSPIGLYLAIGTQGEPELIHSLIPKGAEILDLGSGVGRVAHPLIALGHPVTAVDESAEMLRHVRGAKKVRSKIEDLDLGRAFPCVLLMSNLINSPARTRHRMLRACRRHVAEEGVVLIERYDPKMKVDAGTSEGEYGGLHIKVERGRRGEAKVTYTHPDGRVWTHEGIGKPNILDDDEVRKALARAGLRVSRFFGPRRRWVLARPLG